MEYGGSAGATERVVLTVSWTVGLLAAAAASTAASVLDIAHAPDGGVFVVGQFQGRVDTKVGPGG